MTIFSEELPECDFSQEKYCCENMDDAEDESKQEDKLTHWYDMRKAYSESFGMDVLQMIELVENKVIKKKLSFPTD